MNEVVILLLILCGIGVAITYFLQWKTKYKGSFAATPAMYMNVEELIKIQPQYSYMYKEEREKEILTVAKAEYITTEIQGAIKIGKKTGAIKD